MSFIKRYTNIQRGGIVFTGNTLGLSKLTNANPSDSVTVIFQVEVN